MASIARSLARPFVATGHWYSDAAKKRPVVTAVITTGLKTSAADLFAQKVSFFLQFRPSKLDFDARSHMSVMIEGKEEEARQGLSAVAAALCLRRTRGDISRDISPHSKWGTRVSRRSEARPRDGTRGRGEPRTSNVVGSEPEKVQKTAETSLTLLSSLLFSSLLFSSLSLLFLFSFSSLSENKKINNNRSSRGARRSTGAGTSPSRPSA